LEGSKLVQLLLGIDTLAQFDVIHSQSVNSHLVHGELGRIMTFSKLRVTALTFAPHLVPGRYDIIAVNRQPGCFYDIANGIDKYFHSIRQRRYLLSAILV
jgi:hypothetical protein